MRSILEVGSEQLPLLFYRCQINKVTYKYLFLLKHPNPPCICKKSRPFCSWPAFSCQTDHSDPGSYFFLHHSLLRQLKGALQRYNTVKYHCIRRGILCIHTEEALSYELEALICLRTLQSRLYVAVFQNSQRIRIEVQGTVLIVYALFLIDNVLIQTNFYRQSAVFAVTQWIVPFTLRPVKPLPHFVSGS